MPCPDPPYAHHGEPAVVVLPPAPTAQDMALVCRRVGELLVHARLVVLDVEAVTTPDLMLVDALARAHLAARRLPGEIRVQGDGEDIHRLLRLAGLDAAVVLMRPGSHAAARPSEDRPGTRGSKAE
ncbi:MAG: STAS domain-containing protein [Actinomycetota bacterium]|nr:STAS domain-containing protein [Actinomycetota bacterium]